MKQNIRILIIEDHEIVLWALSAIIEERLANATLLSAPTFNQGLALLEKSRVELVILDIDVPGGNSPDMINRIRSIQPLTRILIHTGMPEEDYSHQYFTTGADGFLSKNSPMATIAEAITTVLDGKKFISPKSQNILAESYLKNPEKKMRYGYTLKLTDREKEIARMLIQGKWTKEIADQLQIKLSTVSTHKARIFEKFDVNSVVELYRKVEKEMPELLN